MINMRSMSAAMNAHGTDKNTNHRYGDVYELMFQSRQEVQLVMEVGIAFGSGMKAWREIFPNATIVGLDIHPCAAASEGLNRMEFHIGDQRNRDDCERAAAGRQFDFICEDASHALDANLLTMFWLLPFVKRGGLYVVEEFHNVVWLRKNIKAMFPWADLVSTPGPFGGDEPLLVLRKR